MQNKKNPGKRRRLAGETTEFLLISLAVAVFTCFFLRYTSASIAETYLAEIGVELTPVRERVLEIWLGSICAVASGAVFLVLFLFMLGQRMAYLLKIIRGVDSLKENRMDARIPVEGNDELTELAERINRLAASEQELAGQEKRLAKERESWVRALSHDIRTPLTSLISYTQLMAAKQELDQTEMRSYIQLVEAKSEQIRELTDRLLGRGSRNLEPVEHFSLFMEQLAAEWEEMLEEHFSCRADLSGLSDFSGMADICSLRRIFDNLASNGEKYADPEYPVELFIFGGRSGEKLSVTICQKNRIRTEQSGPEGKRPEHVPESFGIGLESIRRIAADYNGTAEIRQEDGEFEIRIALEIPECL